MEKFKKEDVDTIVVHHSNRCIDSLFLIALRHRVLNGWEDVGYHFVIGNGIITTDGRVYTARPLEYVGAHVYGYNKRSLGVCLLGDLDFISPTFRQYRSLINLLLSLKEEYNISVENILGHNEIPTCQKTCPGKHVRMDRIRKLFY